ncbi:lipoprotein signal peptidase [Chlamydia felis Fe/C-56]|uniref:Lipoprotein signal peptidase n=1 Tax=Chlamydia felis (strain Fe/C-56) TaxID=264202 RepID=LSPA_CHLFF|nr:signal peptidase II [Chlamydia felis]Q253G9.1 RecName: Full=Lipoprotein signal peptidase; AltName: Full=Prolipoprotein signal peptidase; AltName: Full=Signal peptidase II; Short=SPase II [Chlamydia felis Fe/C-56]BAE81569.1 lipoprotein signal peptidase [Chlamydia felis Fe/C-56]
MSNRSRSTLLTISFFVLIDWVTKLAVLLYRGNLPNANPILYQYSWGKLFFCICPTFNEGAAFGLFSKYKYFLLLIRIVIILGILAFLFLRKKKTSATTRFSLILLCSGAIGNVGDIFFYNHVIDFISIGYNRWSFPTFNFADIFISLGTLIFVYKLYFPTKQKIK